MGLRPVGGRRLQFGVIPMLIPKSPSPRTRTFEELLAEAETTMRSVIYSQIYCDADRQDVLQASRIDLWRAHLAYADELFSPKGLGRVIARRRCTKHRRKLECRSKYHEAMIQQIPRATRPDESKVLLENTIAEEAEILRQVFSVILEKLSQAQRVIFEEYFLEGLSLKQIADRHGWRAATSARYHVVKAIKIIKLSLSARDRSFLAAFCPTRSIDAGRWLAAA